MKLEHLLDRRELMRLGAIAAGAVVLVEQPVFADPKKKFWQLDRSMTKRRVAVFPVVESHYGTPVWNGSVQLLGAHPVLSVSFPDAGARHEFEGYYDVHFTSGKTWRMKPDEVRFHAGADSIIRVDAVVDGSILDFSPVIHIPDPLDRWVGREVIAHEEWR